ncbi:hypothetical protein MHUMG1_05509 [Metarhizium humberi]|uniref:Ecp2 effector protein domain-containing protein n=1 Tax=Metarhizium humberi TaxID=2596975 RepID=A0A9P8M9S0_9HYPO|nr:hypothetical protein MHUMG1_05509 [Metarhizium humberi]
MLGEEGLGCWVAGKSPCLSFPKANKYTPYLDLFLRQHACRARTRHDGFSPRFGLLYLLNMTTFSRTMIHIGRLFLLLACCGWAAGDAAGQSKVPETVEVDLVFPRNDTYAPSPFIPIVFAIQNYHASRPLSLDIWYKLIGGPRWNTTLQRGVIRPNTEYANYSNKATDLRFLYEWTDRLNNTEGNWKLTVELYAANCTRLGRGAAASVHGSLSYTQKYVYFSTRHGAQQPDLVAASKDGVCDKTTGVTFNITEVKEVSWFNRHSVDHDVCPILAPEAPKPNPCLAKVNATTASSILFGVEGNGKNGNIDFHIGGQDIIDIINDAIRMFGSSGRIGAKGNMDCKGTIKDQNVDWGLY